MHSFEGREREHGEHPFDSGLEITGGSASSSAARTRWTVTKTRAGLT